MFLGLPTVVGLVLEVAQSLLKHILLAHKDQQLVQTSRPDPEA